VEQPIGIKCTVEHAAVTVGSQEHPIPESDPLAKVFAVVAVREQPSPVPLERGGTIDVGRLAAECTWAFKYPLPLAAKLRGELPCVVDSPRAQEPPNCNVRIYRHGRVRAGQLADGGGVLKTPRDVRLEEPTGHHRVCRRRTTIARAVKDGSRLPTADRLRWAGK